MSDYFVGSDILGAEDECVDEAHFESEMDRLEDEVLGALNPKGPFVTIHVKNVAELVKKQGGSTGAAALSLVPQTVENAVYSKLAADFASKLKENGVNADVNVVSNLPAIGGSPKDFVVGSVVGASVVGLVIGIVKLLKRR